MHNGLIAAARNALGPLLRPRYIVRLEERTYLAEPEGLELIGRPDLAFVRVGAPGTSGAAGSADAIPVEVPVPDPVRETYLTVRSTATGEVVTVLELLSPATKRPGEGRTIFPQKRRSVLGTRTGLVEIDLLRGGQRMPVLGSAAESHYSILIRRPDRRSRAELLPFSVRDPIPRFSLPLYPDDQEPILDLGALLHALYEAAAYDLSLDYRGEPVPPLAADDQQWTDELLRAAQVR